MDGTEKQMYCIQTSSRDPQQLRRPMTLYVCVKGVSHVQIKIVAVAHSTFCFALTSVCVSPVIDNAAMNFVMKKKMKVTVTMMIEQMQDVQSRIALSGNRTTSQHNVNIGYNAYER